jgi:hypothetical protein
MRQRNVVRTIYLYLVTVVGIVMALAGLIGAITNVLNMYVFRLITSDSMQNEVASLLEFASGVAVGVPIGLFIVMFNLINVAPSIYRAFFMSPDPMMSPVKPDTTGLVSPANTYAIQSLIRNIVAVLVGTPVWLYHWHLGQREHRDLLGN